MRGAVRLVPVLLAAAVAAGRAQAPPDGGRATPPRLVLTLDRDAAGVLRAPVVRAVSPLSGGIFVAALRDGFPVRFHFVLELRHSVRILPDRLERAADWEAVVALDPLTREYTLIRSGGSQEHFTSEAAVDRALATPFTVDLMPGGPGQYYYVGTLEIESLSLSELGEVERWLRGDVGPVIARTGDVGDAVERGLRRLLIRISGLPRRRLETRSPFFTP
ncbi:MAG: hypothetical protein AAB409_08895 [Gemmatimonadota bacterium]